MTEQAKSALVTGAAGGIGRAIVERLQRSGWSVLATDRDQSDVDFALTVGDIADADHRQRLVAAIGDSIGLLVNNAAVQFNYPIEATTDEIWDTTFHSNVVAPFALTRDLLPALRAGHGSIVNVSSVHAFATSENVGAYAVSKGALSQLTRSVALEYAPHGVRCNAVAPGAVQTPMLHDGLSRRPHPDGPAGNLEHLRRRTPLGVVAQPDAIASVVEFLADNTWSSYVTGQTLIADGGATLRLGTE